MRNMRAGCGPTCVPAHSKNYRSVWRQAKPRPQLKSIRIAIPCACTPSAIKHMHSCRNACVIAVCAIAGILTEWRGRIARRDCQTRHKVFANWSHIGHKLVANSRAPPLAAGGLCAVAAGRRHAHLLPSRRASGTSRRSGADDARPRVGLSGAKSGRSCHM